MNPVLEFLGKKTATLDQINKALLTGANQEVLFQFLVDMHTRNVALARSIVMTGYVNHRLREAFEAQAEVIAQELTDLSGRIQNDPERLIAAIQTTLDLKRGELERLVINTYAVDLMAILNDQRF